MLLQYTCMARWTAPLSNDGVFITVSFFEAEISSSVQSRRAPCLSTHDIDHHLFFLAQVPPKSWASGRGHLDEKEDLLMGGCGLGFGQRVIMPRPPCFTSRCSVTLESLPQGVKASKGCRGPHDIHGQNHEQPSESCPWNQGHKSVAAPYKRKEYCRRNAPRSHDCP